MIASEYGLSLADVYAALAYYYDHREEVDQAIKKGARIVWMQEGIVNEAAAQTALEAGLVVVMNTCMRATHKRLIGNG